MKLYEKYEFLYNHIIFSVPYYNEKKEIVGYTEDFNCAVYITPTNLGILVEPCYEYAPDINVWTLDIKDYFHSETYEKAIDKLYNIVLNRFGNYQITDYLIEVGDMIIEKLDNGNMLLKDTGMRFDVEGLQKDLASIINNK